jgi:hypothetical protein
MHKDVKQLVKRAKKQYGITLQNRGHHKWLVGPNGRLIATISSTGSDHRMLANIKGDLKNAGFPLR